MRSLYYFLFIFLIFIFSLAVSSSRFALFFFHFCFLRFSCFVCCIKAKRGKGFTCLKCHALFKGKLSVVLFTNIANFLPHSSASLRHAPSPPTNPPTFSRSSFLHIFPLLSAATVRKLLLRTADPLRQIPRILGLILIHSACPAKRQTR